MLLARGLAAYPAADWPTPRLPIVDAVADLDPRTTPDVENCESRLSLAEPAAFDAVIAMFDLVRAYDRATPVDRESGAFGGL